MSGPLDPRHRRDDIRFVDPDALEPRRPRTAREEENRRLVWAGLILACAWFWWVVFRVAQAWWEGRFPT